MEAEEAAEVLEPHIEATYDEIWNCGRIRSQGFEEARG